ncbi:MAG: hypothetical protein AAB361_03545 [Patescibacteria group bacterium]
MLKESGEPRGEDQKSYADKIIREIKESSQREKDTLNQHKKDMIDEYERLKKITETRPLTDEERRLFGELTK